MKHILKFLIYTIAFLPAYLILLIEGLWMWDFKHTKELTQYYVEKFWSTYFRFKRKR
jgi:hypothetical protein